MTKQRETEPLLDDNVLEEIAWLIYGDDSAPHYRTGRELQKFFTAAGLSDAGECDGYRKDYVLEQLQNHRDDPDSMRAVVLRLADPREYLGAPEVWNAVVSELNELLAVEGYQVKHSGKTPELVEVAASFSRPLSETPLALTGNLAEIVSVDELGEQLQARLDEAHTCWASGAHTAAIIMLGSVLEGVLYDVAISRHDGTGKEPSDHLETLINLAQSKGWFATDLSDYAHVLRNHRNLVHPKKQWTQSYSPKDDTVRIAWNVVVAVLNDLLTVVRNDPRGISTS